MVRLLNAPHTKQAEADQGTIYAVTSDYGAECDDQKAWSQLVARLKPGDVVFVMAGGPQPSEAAKAMAQAVWHKTGMYPVTSKATQFEGNKTPKEKIFSIIEDGKPIHDQELSGFSTVSRSEWQQRIDEAVKSNKFSKLEIDVISPMFPIDEVYDVSRAKSDPELAASLNKLTKAANIQMIRKDKKLQAYNYTKSNPGIPEKFLETAAQAGFTITMVDGNSAKDNAFKISARQPKLPGVENSIGFYIENLQVPWVNMPGPTGTVPQQMHVTMFTPKGEYPCLFHMSGAYPYGFGRERLAKDICAILEPSEYKSFSDEVEKELDRFDTEVLKSHLGEECDVPAMRGKMHAATLGALNTYAGQKGVEGKFKTFTEFFDAVNKMAEETKNEPVASPFTYIGDFTKVLFQENPWYKEITDHAQELVGPSVKILAAIIKKYNAQAVSFDAVTLAAAHTIDKDRQLAEHFTEEDGVRVIDPVKIAALNPDLHEKFVTGVRAEMTRDGTAMAYGDSELGLVKPSKVASARNVSSLVSPVRLAPGESRMLKRTFSDSGLQSDADSSVTSESAPVRRRHSTDASFSEGRERDRSERDRGSRDPL